MPRICLFNILFGFILIFLSSSAGIFLSFDQTRAHLSDEMELLSWWMQLSASAHGHTNLFGMLHVLLGLTMPYAHQGFRLSVAKTVGLGLGSISMSLLMYFKALGQPTLEYDFLGVLIGICLSLALASIALHMLGLAMKLVRNSP